MESKSKIREGEWLVTDTSWRDFMEKRKRRLTDSRFALYRAISIFILGVLMLIKAVM